ncbi:Voltage-dependent calcium channel gamma-5 subunit [Goodea atripinnis]|uniref:Voltage-dependent calcium channel gamma-5 subunit n=1 Tax=Goodea atripinnis TaxID=208336 RepID=A0ABV0PUQ9_9TELE
MIRSATPFPLVSLFFMFIGFVLNNIGHVRPHRTILAFVSGIFFILSEIISTSHHNFRPEVFTELEVVNGETVLPSAGHNEQLQCFIRPNMLFYGRLLVRRRVMSVYLFMKRYTAEEIYQARHPNFYRPRVSNCSDHSGQYLHPESWSRGRSPSDISSEASLQMSASYPALLKCPDYDQVSSSPC